MVTRSDERTAGGSLNVLLLVNAALFMLEFLHCSRKWDVGKSTCAGVCSGLIAHESTKVRASAPEK